MTVIARAAPTRTQNRFRPCLQTPMLGSRMRAGPSRGRQCQRGRKISMRRFVVTLLAAAVAEAKKSPRNWKLAIAVVDPNGDLVYFYKMEQTQVASIGIAQGKARTAARYRRPSGVFFTVMQNPAGAYVSTLDPMLVASHGGFPLIEGGK